MGLMDYGVGLGSFADNFMKVRQANLLHKQRQQELDQMNLLRKAQIDEILAKEAEQKRETAAYTGYKRDIEALPQGMGLDPALAGIDPFSKGMVDYRDISNPPPAMDQWGANEFMQPTTKRAAILSPEAISEVAGRMQGPTDEQRLAIYEKYFPKEAAKLRAEMSMKDAALQAGFAKLGLQQEYGLKTLESKQESEMKRLHDKIDSQERIADKSNNTKLTIADIAAAARKSSAEIAAEGKKERAEEQKRQKMMDEYNQIKNLEAKLDTIGETARTLLGHSGLTGITGIKGAMPDLPTGSAAEAETLRQRLTSETALATLTELKTATKAGLGNVSNKDITLLETAILNLRRGQPIESMKKELKTAIKHVTDTKNRLNEGYQRKWGGQETTKSDPLGIR